MKNHYLFPKVLRRATRMNHRVKHDSFGYWLVDSIKGVIHSTRISKELYLAFMHESKINAKQYEVTSYFTKKV